jgi:ribosomal protein L6P/L9E
MVVERKVTIPAGITAAFTNFTLAVKGPKGELTRDMRYPGVNVAITDGEVVITTESSAWSAPMPRMCRTCSTVSRRAMSTG